jgi:hypothetical protein
LRKIFPDRKSNPGVHAQVYPPAFKKITGFLLKRFFWIGVQSLIGFAWEWPPKENHD